MRREHFGRSAVLPFVLAVVLASCVPEGTDRTEDSPVPSTAPTTAGSPTVPGTPTAPIGLLADCAPAGAMPLKLPVPSGEPVNGMIVGRGSRAVVLSYEWGSTPCAWTDVAAELAGKGYQVALWEYGSLTGLARLAELQAVVNQVRAHGAKKVVLAGGSLGGCVSLIGASRIVPPVTGVAVLSCASWYDVEHRLPTTPWAAKVHVPTLYLAAAEDSGLPIAEVRKDFKAVPAKDKKLVVVPNSGLHGVGLLADAAAAKLTKPAFLSFLDRVSR